jgi:hypothetical protein
LVAIALQTCLLFACLAAIEMFLRATDLRVTRLEPEERRIAYQFDSELGWFPTANTVRQWGGGEYRHNSIGLRDIELSDKQPTILFLGDSFVYGIGTKVEDRFTELLRQKWPGTRIVNAGVAGYGTDQEFLLLKRMWPQIEPNIVVLIVCVENDHSDNSGNFSLYGMRTYKPFLAWVDGEWKFQGLPVPKGRAYYFYNNSLARRSALVRLALQAYTPIRHPWVIVPDPTTQLVVMMRDFVELHGGRFLVGLQFQDHALEPFLKSAGIPYIQFDGAETFVDDIHWNPRGHALVAERLATFLTNNASDIINEKSD